MNRREFLAALPAAVSMSRRGFADAVPVPVWAGWASGGSLVLIELLGGCDGYSLTVPWRDEWYFRQRPGIAIERKDLLPLDDSIGFPSTMAGLHDLFGRGMVAVCRGIGWGGAPSSHFDARRRFRQTIQSLGFGDAGPAGCRSGEGLADRLRGLVGSAGRMPNQVYRFGLSGFDTHAGQGGKGGHLNRLLGDVSEAIADLSRRLIREGAFGNVAILVATEFGRGVDENRFGGTDHGTVAPWLLIGGTITPGIFGPQPQALSEAHAEAAVDLPVHPRRLLTGLVEPALA